jgi:hypothetical protein
VYQFFFFFGSVLNDLNDEKVVYPVKPYFTLDNFAAFVRCYIFLCKVADYVANEIDNVFKEWETEDGRSKFKERSQAAKARPWRDEDEPRSPTTRRRSSSSGGGGTNAQDMEDRVDDGMSDTPNECQGVHGGDKMVQENLQAFDALAGVDSKDIGRWARTLEPS